MRGLKKQKTRRASAPRNRYVARAKLSEHKFLRVLHGYAEGIPIQKLEPRTHVSGKTIRTTYRTLRAHLPLAAQRDHARFANAGAYLFQGESIAPEGRKVIACIEKTRRFSLYIKRHAPRLSSCEDEHLLLLEKAVRIFCALDLRGVEADKHLLARIAEAFSLLHPREPLQKLAHSIPYAKPHAHSEMRLYRDYRQYLLKNPIGARN